MSIEHWLDEDCIGQYAIELVGLPADLSIVFRGGDETRPVLLVKISGNVVLGSERAALALLRDHALEWLAERGYFVVRVAGRWELWEEELRVAAGLAPVESGIVHPDYDAALIAAVLAVEDVT